MIDKKLLNLIGENRKYIYYSVICMVVSLLANLCVTALLCVVLQNITQSSFHILIISFVLMGIAIFVRYSATKKGIEIKDLLGRKVKKDLREKVYRKIVRLHVHTNDKMNMAALTQVAMEGIEQLDLYYSTYIPQFYYAMIAPILLFCISVWIQWQVALVLLLCVPFIPISIIAVSKYAKKIFAKYWNQYTSMGDGFLDSVQGLKELKIFQADALQHQKMNVNSEAFRKITMKVLVMQLASTTIMDLIAYGGAGLGIALTLFYMVQNEISIYAGLFLILIAVDFFLPLRAFGSTFHIAMNGASAGNKIMELLAYEEMKWGQEEVKEVVLEMRNVTFSYEHSRTILNDISILFPKIGMVSIVGESGCGKSTMVHLLLGSYLCDKGGIYIHNMPLHTYTRESYYNRIVLVSYNSYIFHDTVRNNFYHVNPHVMESDIYNALKKVNLYEFIMENGGLDKKLLEDAANLSGGQKQRLALAIHLVSDKDVYIFDEATSNIDIDSEWIIMENIKALAKRKCVIVISHRLANVVDSDEIYYLEDGKIKEKGNHISLLTNQKGYANLFYTQKQLEEGYKEVKLCM